MKCKYKAIILDFDGVIVESSDIKTRAYAKLYKEYGPETVEEVVNYSLIQGGLSRSEHFRYFHQNILKKELSRDEEIRLSERFSQLVERAVVDTPYVPGVIEFLDEHVDTIDFYVASGTPEGELRRIIDARDISHYFKHIYGSPQTKAAIITDILIFSNLEKGDILMIGDSMTDYEGAMTVGIPFIGRVSQDQKDLFSAPILEDQRSFFHTPVTVIRDFNDKMTLHHALS